MGNGGKALRFRFEVTLVLVGVIWLLFVRRIIANHATTIAAKSTMASSTRDVKHRDFVGHDDERLNSYQDFHLNYVSKRRVPNGPDLIHDRY